MKALLKNATPLSAQELKHLTGGRKRYFIGDQEVSKSTYDNTAGTSH